MSDAPPPVSESRPVKPEPSRSFVFAAKVGAVPEGEGRSFVIGERIVALFQVAGEYHAMNDLCPHMGASLSEGALSDGIVSCPWHAWRFNVRDGAWCDNPRVRTESYPTRVVGDEIQVGLPD